MINQPLLVQAGNFRFTNLTSGFLHSRLVSLLVRSSHRRNLSTRPAWKPAVSASTGVNLSWTLSWLLISWSWEKFNNLGPCDRLNKTFVFVLSQLPLACHLSAGPVHKYYSEDYSIASFLTSAMDDVPSTLPQARIAQSLVKAAIAKHNDRYENIFLKAVSIMARLSFS